MLNRVQHPRPLRRTWRLHRQRRLRLRRKLLRLRRKLLRLRRLPSMFGFLATIDGMVEPMNGKTGTMNAGPTRMRSMSLVIGKGVTAAILGWKGIGSKGAHSRFPCGRKSRWRAGTRPCARRQLAKRCCSPQAFLLPSLQAFL